MIGAHAVVNAHLVGSGIAFPLSGVILAHEAPTAKVLAADPHGSSVHTQAPTLRVIAHAMSTLYLPFNSVFAFNANWLVLGVPGSDRYSNCHRLRVSVVLPSNFLRLCISLLHFN